ncbi:medium-chain acyl-CoA ligase ACSF2, mitochondrial-like isoform X2 [Anneissia japonica]|nr:medium-chain acyl-CoA ligase ACSF2, mitochondrial-like isoform X2 [Anneissia japonica]
MPPLVASMTSVFAPSVYNIKQIVQTIQNERCTDVLFLITYLYDMLNFKDIGEYDVTSLDICLTGGSNIPPKMANDFEEKCACKILIAYGSTEMMVPIISSPLDPFATRSTGVRIWPNAEIQLVDDDGKCVPVGSNGEIWCRCCSNFQRYMGNDEQTKAAKSPHGWFKTGDIGVFNAAGVLSVVGRKKDIISKGAIKIFPADIENVLSRHPSIDQVQVIGVPDDRLSEEICVCLRTKKNAIVDKDQIVSFLTGKVRLEESVPGYVLIFDSFPKTITGKIDRMVLTKQAIDRIQSKVQLTE